jgi:hypothetical protein
MIVYLCLYMELYIISIKENIICQDSNEIFLKKKKIIMRCLIIEI